MEEKITNAVRDWLEAIMPAVVETVTQALPEERLREMGKEEGIHGPVSVNLEEFGAPITAIHFHIMVSDETLLMSTTAIIKGVTEKPRLSFDQFFTITGFAAAISDSKHIAQLVDTLLEQFKAATV